MSIPLLIGILVFVIVVAAAAGVWRSRDQGPAAVESSLVLLGVAVVAAVLVLVFFRGQL